MQWFQSYLSNRKQCVTVNGQSSDFAIITCGVPQGSILGPTLFLLYINDLALVSKLFQTIMFADDTNLFVRGKSVEQIKNQINTELLIINEWFKTNRLSLNLDKTTYVIFGNKKFDDIKIYFRDVEIKRQFETKFLGVILQANLKWSTHINIVLSKTSKCLGIMSKIRHLIPQHLTKMLYLTLVEPYINYCNIVWCSPDKTSNLEKNLRVQKKYCRLMTFASFSAPSKPLFLELKLLNVYEIYKYQLAVYMYKILNQLVSQLDHHLFKRGNSIHSHDTRFKNDLRKMACRTRMRQITICFQGPKLWNSLPNSIKCLPSLSSFKRNMKSWFFV